MIRPLAAVLALAGLAACATMPAGDDLAAYPASLMGVWTNDAQFAAAPEELKRAPAGAGEWLDRQTLTFAASPTDPNTVQVSWNTPEAQRLQVWRFRRAGADVRLDMMRSLSTPVDDQCALVVTSSARGAWDARTDPERCIEPTQDGRTAQVDIRITVMPTGLLYQETATLPDGSFAFRRPGGTPYDFRRAP